MFRGGEAEHSDIGDPGEPADEIVGDDDCINTDEDEDGFELMDASEASRRDTKAKGGTGSASGGSASASAPPMPPMPGGISAGAASSSSSTSPMPPPVADSRADESDAASTHKCYWLTRTNRGATCSRCKEKILPNEFRLIYEPDKKNIKDLRRWRDVFWTYQHLKASCVQHLPAPFVASELQVDVAPLPRRMKESESDRAAAIQDDREKAAAAFSAPLHDSS